jgi:predicted phosphodiesterase
MRTLTIFGDIHGNLPALEAVFEDMDARGLSERYCLGDLVGYGTFPNEVVDMIRDSKIRHGLEKLKKRSQHLYKLSNGLLSGDNEAIPAERVG